jgi:hypothetical protein
MVRGCIQVWIRHSGVSDAASVTGSRATHSTETGSAGSGSLWRRGGATKSPRSERSPGSAKSSLPPRTIPRKSSAWAAPSAVASRSAPAMHTPLPLMPSMRTNASSTPAPPQARWWAGNSWPSSVVDRWAERKPLAAWKMVLSNGGPPEALISVMRVMAERQPAGSETRRS